MTNQFNVIEYINQFNILGSAGDIHCENISYDLYSAILNKFKVTMDEDEYSYFKEYQDRMFDLVENLRELSEDTIGIVFDYLQKNNYYLIDIIIMIWCLPRSDNYLSKRMYNNIYRKNIEKYNWKLVKIINHETMKNFCIETLTKTNNVPVHCIDYVWFYMNTISLEFSFYNSESGSYIGFTMPEHIDDHDNDNDKTNEYIIFGFNMEFLLDMGLGKVFYENDLTGKGSLRNFLKRFVTDADIVEKLLTTKTRQNYYKQLRSIQRNPSKFFGDSLTALPIEVTALCDKFIK